MKFAYAPRQHLVDVDGQAERLFREALRKLQNAGAELVEIDLGDDFLSVALKIRNIPRAAVPKSNPDDLRRSSVQDAEPMEVFVLRHQHAAEIDGALPHNIVSRTTEAKWADVHRVCGQILNVLQEGLRQLLVDEQPHDYAAGIPRVLRSRSAA